VKAGPYSVKLWFRVGEELVAGGFSARDAGVFYGVNEVGGVKVVSTVQLYVDLFNHPARGEEASEMVLKALEKQWISGKDRRD